MKQGTLVRTLNVIAADRCIEYLLNRPKMEMVGLGLIYGKPGLGKTTYASRMKTIPETKRQSADKPKS